MNKMTVHDRKTQERKYRGEAEAAPLLGWLNARSPSDKKKLAVAYVEEIMTAIQSLPPDGAGAGEEGARKIRARLNAAFNKYELVRTCAPGEAPGGWIFPLRVSHDLSTDWVRGEADSIEQIVKLAEMGKLGQVRKCECGEYFFVRFPNREPENRFHATECRVKFWESSPDRKKQKKDKAKEYYRLHREKNIK
jgi:hypothetical protein